MKERLTLTIDPGVMHRAKRLARERASSLSAMVESLLEREVGKVPRGEPVVEGSFSGRWAGKLRIVSRRDARFERLARKHGL